MANINSFNDFANAFSNHTLVDFNMDGEDAILAMDANGHMVACWLLISNEVCYL